MAGALAASDVASAGAALAGLTLVFLGHTAAAYHGHPTRNQPAVRKTYQVRAWMTFVGFVLSLAASLLALIGEWRGNDGCLISSGGIALGAAFLVVLVTALHTVRGIS
jgi:hypothetical protein